MFADVRGQLRTFADCLRMSADGFRMSANKSACAAWPPSGAGIDMDSDCDNVKIIGGTSLLNSFGVDLNGTHNIVADLTCHSNTNVDRIDWFTLNS